MTKDEIEKAADRARQRVHTYLRSRKRDDAHNLSHVFQVITSDAEILSDATGGELLHEHAGNAVEYLSQRIQTIVNGTGKKLAKAEAHLALELLADELGIKNDVVKRTSELLYQQRHR